MPHGIPSAPAREVRTDGVVSAIAPPRRGSILWGCGASHGVHATIVLQKQIK